MRFGTIFYEHNLPIISIWCIFASFNNLDLVYIIGFNPFNLVQYEKKDIR